MCVTSFHGTDCRALTSFGKEAKAGDVFYIERHITLPNGDWARVTKITLSEPVAMDAHTREPMFDWSLCKRELPNA